MGARAAEGPWAFPDAEGACGDRLFPWMVADAPMAVDPSRVMAPAKRITKSDRIGKETVRWGVGRPPTSGPRGLVPTRVVG